MTETVYKDVICTARINEKKMGLFIFPGQDPLTSRYIKPIDPATALEAGSYYRVDLVIKSSAQAEAVSTVRKMSAQPTISELDINKTKFQKILNEEKEAEARANSTSNTNVKQAMKIPAPPEHLVIKEDLWNLACGTLMLGMYPLLLGPKGAGKTELAECLASAMGAEFYPFNMGAATKPKQFFCGMVMAKENSHGNVETELIKSEFLKAFTSEKKTYIFLDEFTRLPQQAESYLMTVLDRKQNYIYVEELGQRVVKGENVSIIAAGNVGQQYTGTRTIDGAFWDRFEKHQVYYLKASEEKALVLSRVPGCPVKQLETLISRANATRKAEETGALGSAISTRQVLNMAKFLAAGFPLELITKTLFMNNFLNGNTNDIEDVTAMIQSGS